MDIESLLNRSGQNSEGRKQDDSVRPAQTHTREGDQYSLSSPIPPLDSALGAHSQGQGDGYLGNAMRNVARTSISLPTMPPGQDLTSLDPRNYAISSPLANDPTHSTDGARLSAFKALASLSTRSMGREDSPNPSPTDWRNISHRYSHSQGSTQSYVSSSYSGSHTRSSSATTIGDVKLPSTFPIELRPADTKLATVREDSPIFIPARRSATDPSFPAAASRGVPFSHGNRQGRSLHSRRQSEAIPALRRLEIDPAGTSPHFRYVTRKLPFCCASYCCPLPRKSESASWVAFLFACNRLLTRSKSPTSPLNTIVNCCNGYYWLLIVPPRAVTLSITIF
jgi:hypothetical protein